MSLNFEGQLFHHVCNFSMRYAAHDDMRMQLTFVYSIPNISHKKKLKHGLERAN